MSKEKVIGKSHGFRQERQFGIEGTAAELYLLQGYTSVLSAYGAKEKRSAQQLPPPRNVPGTRGIGLHRREAVFDMVARTDSEHAVRDEDAVVQDDLPLDRRKLSAFHLEKSAEKRKDEKAFRERGKIYNREQHTEKG